MSPSVSATAAQPLWASGNGCKRREGNSLMWAEMHRRSWARRRLRGLNIKLMAHCAWCTFTRAGCHRRCPWASCAAHSSQRFSWASLPWPKGLAAAGHLQPCNGTSSLLGCPAVANKACPMARTGLPPVPLHFCTQLRMFPKLCQLQAGSCAMPAPSVWARNWAGLSSATHLK